MMMWSRYMKRVMWWKGRVLNPMSLLLVYTLLSHVLPCCCISCAGVTSACVHNTITLPNILIHHFCFHHIPITSSAFALWQLSTVYMLNVPFICSLAYENIALMIWLCIRLKTFKMYYLLRHHHCALISHRQTPHIINLTKVHRTEDAILSCRWYVPLKQDPPTSPHSVTTQNTMINIFIFVRTSNLRYAILLTFGRNYLKYVCIGLN